MKVLALKSKHSTEYWDATKNENAAFLAAFQFNDELESYADLDANEVRDAEQELSDLLALKDGLDIGGVQKALLREAERMVTELSKAMRYVESLRHQVDLYRKAKKGDGAAAKALFQRREGYEYEGWDIVNVQKPGAPRKKR